VYKKKFNDSTEVEKLSKQKAFKALSEAEREAELHKRYLALVQAIERDKLYHFVMASDQKHPVLVIRAPADSKAQKAFLGYDWSTAKGDEGIKLVKDAAGRHLTRLYDEADRFNPSKLNALIAQAFASTIMQPEEMLAEFAKPLRLVDMLDFSRPTFEKQIILSAKSSVLVGSTRYPMEPLANLNKMLRRGKSASYGESSIQIIKSGQARGGRDFDFSQRHFVAPDFILDERKLEKGDLLINSTGKGTAGRVTYFDQPGDFVVDSHIAIFRCNAKALPKFVLYSLERIGFKALESLAQGSSGQIELSIETIGQIKIPLPPLEIQTEVIRACEEIEKATDAAEKTIVGAQREVDLVTSKTLDSDAPRIEIDSIAINVQYGLSEKMNESSLGYKIFRMNEIAQRRMVMVANEVRRHLSRRIRQVQVEQGRYSFQPHQRQR